MRQTALVRRVAIDEGAHTTDASAPFALFDHRFQGI